MSNASAAGPPIPVLPSSVISDPEDMRTDFFNKLDEILNDIETKNIALEAAAPPPAATEPAPAAEPAAAEPAPVTRASRRLAVVNAQKAVEKAAAAERAATLEAARIEAEERRQAAKAAAKGPQGAELATLSKVPNAIYEAACQNILPIFMVPTSALNEEYEAPTAKFGLGELLSKRLTPVCELIYGVGLTQDLAEGFSQPGRAPYIRNFFEITKANDQCQNVIGDWRGTDPPTKCWICDVGVNACGEEKGTVDCEHKLSVLPALLLTGLFDRRFAKLLTGNGLSEQYKNLLKEEYAWSHSRCNQIKTDDVFITYAVSREKIVTFLPNVASIQSTLATILTHTSYKPTKDELWDCIEKQALPTPPPTTKKDWPGWRTAGVAAQLNTLCTKLNARNYTTKQLVSHFVNGLLDRAINLAPALVNKYINTPNGPKLTPAQLERLQALLAPPTGGARHRTRHRRSNRKRTWRKTYRGGADEGYEDMAGIALSLTKAACIDDLPAKLSSLDSIASSIEEALDKYQLSTDQNAMDVLRMARVSKPRTVQQLCVAIARVLQTGPISSRMKTALEKSLSTYDRTQQTAAAAAASVAAAVEEDGEAMAAADGEVGPAQQQQVEQLVSVGGPALQQSATDLIRQLTGRKDPKLGDVNALAEKLREAQGVRTQGERRALALEALRILFPGEGAGNPFSDEQIQLMLDAFDDAPRVNGNNVARSNAFGATGILSPAAASNNASLTNTAGPTQILDNEEVSDEGTQSGLNSPDRLVRKPLQNVLDEAAGAPQAMEDSSSTGDEAAAAPAEETGQFVGQNPKRQKKGGGFNFTMGKRPDWL